MFLYIVDDEFIYEPMYLVYVIEYLVFVMVYLFFALMKHLFPRSEIYTILA